MKFKIILLFLFSICFFYQNSSFAKIEKFIIPNEMKDRVAFWVKVYSDLSVDEGVFHLVDHPDVILGKINFKNIKNNIYLNSYEKQVRMNRLVKSERIKLAEKWKIKDLHKIRLQTGLKERMKKAIYLSGRYLPMMEKIFRHKNLPTHLTRLVFVESSFNIYAQSKVGASGLWQIMPSVADSRGYRQRYFDKRNHPYYSTWMAADILSENYRELGSWPLAITAYNHGAYGVKKMVNINQTRNIASLIKTKNTTRSWGFASKNFYACFLAVLYVEKNASILFNENIQKARPLVMNRAITNQKIPKKTLLSHFKNNIYLLKKYNPHLEYSHIKRKKYIPAGVPLIFPYRFESSFYNFVGQ